MSFPNLNIENLIEFPHSHKGGIVAYGGNLSPGVLLSAYLQGIFPWYNKNDPITWWSPNPRFVLLPQNFHIPKSLRKFISSNDRLPENSSQRYFYTQNKAFSDVINFCATTQRPDQNGTWIHPEMIEAYTKLFELGYAHSFETWQNNTLVGGFYGVLIGSIFFGESMFALKPNASKSVFVKFVQQFIQNGGKLIDSQVYTDHIARFGAKNISRDAFLRYEKDFLPQKLKNIDFFNSISS